MSEMVPLPPEEEERERPGWVLPVSIVSAVLAVALIGYSAWMWFGGQSASTPSFLSFLSRSPSSDATIATYATDVPLVSGGATATPTEAASLPTATPSPTSKSPTATPTVAQTETPLPTETSPVPEGTDQPSGGEGTDEMPPTGVGTAYVLPIAMALAVVLLLARVLRTRYQG